MASRVFVGIALLGAASLSAWAKPECGDTVARGDHPFGSSALFQLPPHSRRYLLWLLARTREGEPVLGVSSYVVRRHANIHFHLKKHLGEVAAYLGGGELLIENPTSHAAPGEVLRVNDACGMLYQPGERPAFLDGVDLSSLSLGHFPALVPSLFPGLVASDPRLVPSRAGARHLYEPLNRFDEWLRHDIDTALRVLDFSLGEWLEGQIAMSPEVLRTEILEPRNPHTGLSQVEVLPSLVALLRNDRVDHARLPRYEALVKGWLLENRPATRESIAELYELNHLVRQLYDGRHPSVADLVHVEHFAVP